MKTNLQVKYQTEIRRASDGATVKKNPWQKNLVLDLQLTALANAAHMSSFGNCAVGSGNTANKIASSPVTISQTASAHAISSAPFFTSAMVGGILKYGTGSGGVEYYIKVFNSTTDVTVDTVATVTAQVATVWQVQRTKLATFSFNADAIQQSPGSNGTTPQFSAGVCTITHQRTFIFNQKGSPYTVNEIAWGTDTSSNPDIKGRAVLASSDVIGTDHFYVVTIQLIYTIAPAEPGVTTVGTSVFDNFSGDYDLAITLEQWRFFQVDSNGGDVDNFGGCIDSTNGSGSVCGIILIVDPAFTQNANIQNNDNNTSSPYASRAFNHWAQVGGQNPGVSQQTFSLSFSTNGETLYGIGYGLNGNVALDILATYNDTPSALPVGTFVLNGTLTALFTRTLTN